MRLLTLRPVPAKAEGEREPRGLRRRPRWADARVGLPADGLDVAASQEQDSLHPHCLRRAARHAQRCLTSGYRPRMISYVHAGKQCLFHALSYSLWYSVHLLMLVQLCFVQAWKLESAAVIEPPCNFIVLFHTQGKKRSLGALLPSDTWGITALPLKENLVQI